MEAVAHNPAFAKKVGVPQSVGKDFSTADKGKTFKRGGDMKESKAMVKKEVSFMKKKGAPKSMLKHEMAEAGMNNGGKVKKMAMGGQAGASMDPRKAAMIAQMMKAKRSGARPGMAPAAAPAPTAMPGMKKGGMPMVMKDGKKVPAFAADNKGKMSMGGMAYAKGGGIESKGKTKGKMIVMKSGGSAKKYC